ncbi:MAG TPA: SGNH/GDSL hydrolase family protein [Chthoniobacteraceae bacterium]|nr:SGNH/GDSL hydrolase family protein [Chthoniobacteraceae bacterium]
MIPPLPNTASTPPGAAFAATEGIDRIYRNQSASDGLQWLDAFDSRLALLGHGWPREARAARSFRRLPDRAVGGLSQAVRNLSHCPAGLCLAFATDASEIAVRMANHDATPMLLLPMTGCAGAELFRRDGRNWTPMAVAVPSLEMAAFERRLLWDLPKTLREYRLYLPLYKGVHELSLGFSPEAEIRPSPAPPGARPIVFYGTSITQGGCASTAGSDFVSRVGRLLEAETINLGFSGNGKGEPEVAERLCEINARLWVLDYFSNCDPDRVRTTLPEFVRILRSRHPRAPIVLMGTVGYNLVTWNLQARTEARARREEVMRFYLRAREAGEEHLHFIDGEGLLPPRTTGAYVDGIHPTSLGFERITERLVPQLETILDWEGY